MYCKKCGKQIDDDAQFCKYCGQNVGENTNKTSSTNIVEWFQGKSRGFRLVSVIGVLWLFIGICFLFVCEYAEDYLAVLVVFIGLPLLAWSIWYYFKFLRKKKDATKKLADASLVNDVESLISKEKAKELPLLEFAKLYGDMKVASYADSSTGNTYKSCIFTKTTVVSFSKELGELTAAEIAERKKDLVVKESSNGIFELISKK